MKRCTALCLLVGLTALCPQTPSQAPANGFRLYQSRGSNDIRLVDTTGTIVHTWATQFFSFAIDIQDDGNVLQTVKDPSTPAGSVAGVASGFRRWAFDGTLLWDYYNEPGVFTHHDIEPLPNGNVLLIAWDQMTAAEAIAQGRNPRLLPGTVFRPDSIIEVQQTGPTSGTIVWRWNVMDHVIQDFDPTKANFGIVGNHPELADLNFPNAVTNEFNHANGIDYDPIHDRILISANKQDEIWIIDHSTTTAEAAGHSGGRWGKGGDLLYRWGNPRAYRAGPISAKMINHQHAPRFIPAGYPGAGNVTVFNNGYDENQSAVFELVLPLDASGQFVFGPGGQYGPAAPIWTYTEPGFFSFIMSSAQRLPNGNTLVCSAEQNWIFEVTPAGQRVWEHRGGGGLIFHAHYTDRTLWTIDPTVPAATGGRVDFNLMAGSTAADNTYLLLCSASGTTPGTPILGVTLPLNPDPFLILSATYPNAAPVFIRTLGQLGSLGDATAAFTLPAGAPIGLQLHFAYALFHQTPLAIKSASNAVPVLTF